MSPSLPDASWRRDLLLLVLVFGFVLGWRLGSAPLNNPDEGRYAEVPREMVASGDWTMPQLNAVPYFEKPPFVYWIIAASERFIGPGEWSLRLTPALFALGGILAAYAAVRRLYGRDAGFWAAIVLGTSLLYAALGRILLLDMPVSVLMSLTLFCFILGVESPPGPGRRWFFYGLYASAALATLTKGLMGFLLTGAVMFLWLLVFNQWKRLLPMYLPSGLALFFVIAAPWHFMAAARNPGWAHFYFIHEHLERYTQAEGHGRYQPWWFFIPVLLLGLFPWTGFLVAALRDTVLGGWARRRENATAWFFVTWAGFMFAFFSASQSKLITYILPVFAPLAVLIGRWLGSVLVLDEGFGRLKAGLRVFGFLCGLIAAALCVVVLKPGIIRDPLQAAQLRPYAYALAALLCAGGLRALVPTSSEGVGRGRSAAVSVAATAALMIAVLSYAAPIIDQRSTRDIAQVARSVVRPGDRVYHYHAFFHDFTYYTGQPVGLVNYQDELELQFLDPKERARRFIDDAAFRKEWAGTGRVFAVARIRDAAALFADPDFHYHLVATGPHHYLFSNQP